MTGTSLGCAALAIDDAGQNRVVTLHHGKSEESLMLQRRTLLAAVAVAAASPALAQNTARGNRGNMSNAEEQYIQQTMATGSLSLALSRLAEQKVQSPKLKEFSRFEVAEQETVADVLASLLNPTAISGQVKPVPEGEVEQHLTQQDRQALQKLRSTNEVPEFERQYLDAEIEGHTKLLQVQQQYLSSGRDIDAINVAKLASGMIKEHLQLLADIRSQMGSTTGTAPRGR
jgi:putative membrane protein